MFVLMGWVWGGDLRAGSRLCLHKENYIAQHAVYIAK